MKTPTFRWDFPEDRFKLDRWINSKSLTKRLRWFLRDVDETLVICLEYNGFRIWHNVTRFELNAYIGGWRAVIARVVVKCRRAIRKNVEASETA